MKRKLDKNKIYAFIGRAVVWTSIHILLGIAMFDVAINCMTVYRQEEGMEDKKPNGLSWFALGFSIASLIAVLLKQGNYRNNNCNYR